MSSDIHINPGPTALTNLSLAHLNVRSLLSLDKFDIFALSETWLSSNELDELYIDGYHLPLIKNRSLGRGGGVALYLANHLAFNRRHDFEIPELELLWSEVFLPNSKILIGVCYRPPRNLSTDIDRFMELIQESIDRTDRTNYTMTIIVGDFYAHFCLDNQSSTAIGTVFAHFLRGNNLFQLIKEPTRITALSQTILDLMITDSPGYCTSSFTLSPPSNCDHNVVVAQFNLFVPKPKAYKRVVWNFNSVDVGALNNTLIHTINWDDLFNIL